MFVTRFQSCFIFQDGKDFDPFAKLVDERHFSYL